MRVLGIKRGVLMNATMTWGCQGSCAGSKSVPRIGRGDLRASLSGPLSGRRAWAVCIGP